MKAYAQPPQSQAQEAAARPVAALCSNHPAAVAQRRLQELADNSPAAQKHAALADMANNSPRTVRQDKAVAQRKVTLATEEGDYVIDDIELVIRGCGYESGSAQAMTLRTWDASAVEHAFPGTDFDDAHQKLLKAINRTQQVPSKEEGNYSQQNFNFSTKANGRLPTLYFVAGEWSGRIRQQHDSGPTVVSQTNKVDYFHEDEAPLRRFRDELRKLKKANRAARKMQNTGETDSEKEKARSLVVAHGEAAAKMAGLVRQVPKDDDFHLEVTYLNGSNIPKKTHLSAGKVVSNRAAYDDKEIRRIYNATLGRPAPAGPAAAAGAGDGAAAAAATTATVTPDAGKT